MPRPGVHGGAPARSRSTEGALRAFAKFATAIDVTVMWEAEPEAPPVPPPALGGPHAGSYGG